MAVMVMFVATMLCGVVMAEAPSSGDGISTGSGWDDDHGQTGEPELAPEDGAPSSGDGVPDGSGW